MYCEIPVFKRCCCCLPLRAGLIGYGYLKIALLCIYLAIIVIVDAHITATGWIILAFIFLTEIGMTLAFLIGGHMKRPLPLKIYMWYIIVTTGILIFFQMFVFFGVMGRFNEQIIVTLALDVVLQMYLVFLIRSEVLKLQTDSGLVRYIMPEVKTDIKPQNV